MRMAFWRAKTKKASEITEGRFPVDRLPAVTDEYYLVGTGANMEERAVAGAGKSIATGSYTGDGVDDRQITTGFKCSMVIILHPAATIEFYFLISNQALIMKAAAYEDQSDRLYIHTSNGFLLHSLDAANTDTNTYYYWAISE